MQPSTGSKRQRNGSTPYLVSARLLLQGADGAIPNGAVVVSDGLIKAVGERREFLHHALPEIRLPRHILAPGLINAHTHLALTNVKPKAEGAGFVPWIAAMASTVPAIDRASLSRGYTAGVDMVIATGTTAVADIVPLALLAASRTSPLAGIRYAEVLGFDRDFPRPSPELRVDEGLSPHAPYSTSPKIYRECAKRAVRNRTRLALHVAESKDEEDFLRTGRGPLRELLESKGRIPHGWRPPGSSAVRYLDGLGVLTPTTLVVHATFANRTDRAILKRSGASVVTCPRSNLSLTGKTAPVPLLLRSGVTVALGTDSLASSPSLSLLDELRALRAAHPGLTAAEAVEIATRGGAVALGLEAGRIEPGLRADLAAFRLAGAELSPAEHILAAKRATFVAIGGVVHRGPTPK